MLLVGRHGTTKHVVKSVVFQCKHIQSLHRYYSTSSLCLSSGPSRPESSDPTPLGSHEKSFAVLGGGVTGLSAAYFLTRKFPNANVTIYERSKRLGGWVDSEIVEVDGGQVLFEWGPRSLRPDFGGPGKITIQLLYELGLAEDIVATHRDHPAARNRYIYYPDHLVRMPAPYSQTGILTNFFLNLRTLLTEPIFKGMIGGMVSEPTVKTRPRHVEDESVGDFVRRRFGPTIADNMLSALFHGIYAGDIYNLSARTLLPKFWFLETRDPEGAGIIPELFELKFKNEQIFSRSDAATLFSKNPFRADGESPSEIFRSLGLNMMRQSVYTFTKGIGHLTQRLEHVLRQNPNVEILDDTTTAAMHRDPDSGSIVTLNFNHTEDIDAKHDYVISSLGPRELMRYQVPQLHSSLRDFQRRQPRELPSSASSAADAISDAATVMVVNLYYSNPNLTDPYRGFGYLIPQSIPMEQNPERALGVIFASETSGPRGPRSESPPSNDLSTLISTNHQDTAPGTKLTVMLGGHWWASWDHSDLPTPSAAVEMAKSVLARHMGITDAPLVAKAKLQSDAIPQYRVGHRKAMARMHDELQGYQGRLRVAGPAWQGGVGVNDCIRKAWEVVEDLALGDDLVGDGGWKTGIEEYTKDEEWVVVGVRGTIERRETARHASP